MDSCKYCMLNKYKMNFKTRVMVQINQVKQQLFNENATGILVHDIQCDQ